MKRFHVHLRVADIESSVRFYSMLFGAEPAKREADYAKWMLDDPRVNFAISARSVGEAGVDHLGIQVESDGELRDLAKRLKAAGEMTRDEEAVTCCYARGNKSWVNDPAGVRWETFFTSGDATNYGEDSVASATSQAGADACCAAPVAANEPACCS